MGRCAHTGDAEEEESPLSRCAGIVKFVHSLNSVEPNMSMIFSFLNDVDRIAVKSYQPPDDDIIRARLRTLGVQEYRFILDHG